MLSKLCFLVSCLLFATTAQSSAAESDFCRTPAGADRVICAEIAALDQTLVYNRFGSFNPFGMIYALKRDLAAGPPTGAVDAARCDEDLGIGGPSAELAAGNVRLRDCKRPRPLTLRANAGDILVVRLWNYLAETPDFSSTFCGSTAAQDVSRGDDKQLEHGEVSCGNKATYKGPSPDGNWPATRGVNLAIQGLTAFGIDPQGNRIPAPEACVGLGSIPRDAYVDCYFEIFREGPYFMASTAAPSGGEGDGGSITHGLFGAVIAQNEGTRWYRSQVSEATLAAAGGMAALDYEAKNDELPLLNMLRPLEGNRHELVHSDLNAIVVAPDGGAFREFSVFFHDELKTFYTSDFDDLGAFADGQLAGVRDGFAINYGASGMGTILMANRKGFGPAANCAECLYEEFFLTSWANGDPALLERYSDDPSNVHHSYLNDRIVFRNFHAGPKETHVFHLHAHQWFAGNDRGRGSYLDSQTVAPQQAFSYDISGGGMDRYAGGEWMRTGGSGNRNRTFGDSIFHCHLYPHFAQGMWELWRVHDVLEDGTRKLPDGQWLPGLAMRDDPGTRPLSRLGSVWKATGQRIVANAGTVGEDRIGTPIPAIVPLPDRPLPPAPSYAEGEAVLQADGTLENIAPDAEQITSMPGYPFYISGEIGHRPPQAPLDIARKHDFDAVSDAAASPDWLDGGLPRHVLTDASTRKPGFHVPDPPADETETQRRAREGQVIAKALALGDMTLHLETAEMELLPYEGTPIEKAAMAFHHDGTVPATGGLPPSPLIVKTASGEDAAHSPAGGGWVTGSGKIFSVNGAPPAPGAPFSDPCGVPLGLAGLLRNADGSYSRATHDAILRNDDGTYRLNDALPQPLDKVVAAAGAGFIPATDQHLTNWVRYASHPNDYAQLFFESPDGSHTPVPPHMPVLELDPLTSYIFASDPAVIGFRRYEASAVQLDLVTNRAGWHDPQARINVLSAASGGYKNGAGKISPKISAEEQPFFFRARSGECIEFRHTNELPKELKLDDFQVRTPTDTIGQHIHLVKFDVTSSDGSGNGWNYEDGTLAPDEIAIRICAARNSAAMLPLISGPTRAAGELKMREAENLCRQEADGHWRVRRFDIWKEQLSTSRDLFQTTVQRWFADPVLSGDGSPLVEGKQPMLDRTLRTVFSHDHFGPSSIQQHGFYTALLIEPQDADVCGDGDCWQPRTGREPILSDMRDVGARKEVIVPRHDPSAPETLRKLEFALAVADFATLYDPRDRNTAAEFENPAAGGPFGDGMARIFCEAWFASNHDGAAASSGMAANCGSALSDDGGWHAAEANVPPAWLAAGRPGDVESHRLANFFAAPQAQDDLALLKARFIGHRRMAAGYAPDDPSAPLARPVAAPARPESISVDHHDPYLLNYRGEPLPLRLGTDSRAGSDCELKEPTYWATALAAGVTERCSIDSQKPGDEGDAALAFSSSVHGDPATRPLAVGHRDQVQIRLIQGAQEVQHTFTLEGFLLSRNIDQHFPAEQPAKTDLTPAGTLARECADLSGRPHQYLAWLRHGAAGFADPADQAYWQAQEARMARCFNSDGLVGAQEVGLSEHFEFGGSWLFDVGGAGGAVRTFSRSLAPTVAAPAPVADCSPPSRGIPAVSDSLIHLGSSDAIWNGAWSLLRVARPDGNAISRPLACPVGTKRVHAALVAIEARRLAQSASGATVYRAGVSDPDGMFLALVDPRRLVAPGASITDRQNWCEIPVARVIEEVRRVYERPEPMVLNVKAGECLDLTILNALRPREDEGLLDRPGDAAMPRITPLNVDVDWQRDESGEDAGPSTFTGETGGDLRPSARIALSLALPLMGKVSDTAHPVGASATPPLEGVPTDGTLSLGAQIEQRTYYAGQMVLTNDPSDAPDVPDADYKAIPYAFGAVPIRPLSDIIGQTAHGLFGAVVVVPENSDLTETRILRDPVEDGFVLAPDPASKLPLWTARLQTTGPKGATHTIRQFTLFWQDGLNLTDAGTKDRHLLMGQTWRLVTDCEICDDSYDLGEQGASYRTEPFHLRLRDAGHGPLERLSNLNEKVFPSGFLKLGPDEIPAATGMPVLQATAGEEVVIHILHPGGRARQRSFATIGQDYDDLFPGFGFPRAALLAPGKAITASLTRPVEAGCYLWFDGTTHLRAGGTWGLLDVTDAGGESRCAR